MKHGIKILAASLLTSASGLTMADCSRETLDNTIDQYFTALAAHDTASVPLADDVRFTENGYELNLGDGLWETAGAVQFSRDALDTESCSTVTQAVIEEDGRNILLGVRLKLDDANRISEIEHVIAREEEFAFTPDNVLNSGWQDWERELEIRQRTSRAAMRAAANDYFDEFAEEADVNAPFAHPCHRWENGFHTTARGADCSPANTGLVILHGERRVPVIDRERGIAVAFVHFARNLPDMHMFKFRSGHIELIQSVIGKGGAGTMGWGDDPTLSRREAAENEQMSAPIDPEEAN